MTPVEALLAEALTNLESIASGPLYNVQSSVDQAVLCLREAQALLAEEKETKSTLAERMTGSDFMEQAELFRSATDEKTCERSGLHTYIIGGTACIDCGKEKTDG